MITSQDRSGYIGASDTKMLFTNRDTKTYRNFWLVKLGVEEKNFIGNIYTEAGNKYEHPILTTIDESMSLDEQIIIEKLKLRVNYDGIKDGVIYEVKTHKAEKEFSVSKAYWQQAQVEMYAYQQEREDFSKLVIVSYGLSEEDYLPDVEPKVIKDNIKYHEVKYDKGWVKGEYLPLLKEAARYIRKGKIPV